MNSLNRGHVTVTVGAVAATKEIGVIQAHKKMIVRNLSIVDVAAIAASGANYVTYGAKVNNVSVGTAVDTQLGLAARSDKAIVMPSDGLTNDNGITLEKGDFLSVDLTVTGTGALTNAGIHADIEIVGN